ncbi:MAG: KilA-N, DNA-binding domain protein [Mucilaginibacter sp.]|nr:KilA-N, DNA-binding domain protein [Mucilaginibacter sp.]
MIAIQSIQNRIYEIRGERVMLDMDLAALYEVETRVLNQSIKRNIKRFPEDFMFQLSATEWQNMSSRNVTTYPGNNPSSQFVMMDLPKNRAGKYLPYAFTEQGVAMLSGILNSDTAINMNIAIMRAFVAIRKLTLNQMDLKEQLQEIKERLGEHDVQLNQIYDAMENLMDEKIAQKKWDDRERIGFKK